MQLAISDGGLGQNLGRAFCCHSPLTRHPGTLCRAFCFSPGLELFMSTLKMRARSCKLFIVSSADVQNWPKSSSAQLPIPILLANLFRRLHDIDFPIAIAEKICSIIQSVPSGEIEPESLHIIILSFGLKNVEKRRNGLRVTCTDRSWD